MVTTIIKEDIQFILDSKQIDWQIYEGKTILITGSTGMIGQYLTLTFLYLQKRYDLKIILLVRNIEKCKKIFHDFLNDNVLIIYSDFEIIPEINCNVDYIIHGASLASPVYYETIPVDVIVPNVIGLYELLKLAKKKNTKKLLFMSSSEIYGLVDSNINYTEENLGITDCAIVRNCYSESKRMGENLCNAFTKQYNSVRIYHTYGPTMNINEDKRAFCEFVKNIVESNNIQVKGDGKAKRPFLYITDAIEAFLLIIQNGVPGQVYNMSNEKNYISISALANELINLYPEKELEVEYTKRNNHDQYSEKKDENQVTASSKKLIALGWNPKIDIQNGFKRTIDSKLEELDIKHSTSR